MRYFLFLFLFLLGCGVEPKPFITYDPAAEVAEPDIEVPEVPEAERAGEVVADPLAPEAPYTPAEPDVESTADRLSPCQETPPINIKQNWEVARDRCITEDGKNECPDLVWNFFISYYCYDQMTRGMAWPLNRS